MQSKSTLNLKITLNSLEELFDIPTPNPFNPTTRYQSGIEEILSELRLHPSAKLNTLTLQLLNPTKQSVATIETAIRRHVKHNIDRATQEIVIMKKVAVRDFIWAIIISVGLIVGGSIVIAKLPLPANIASLFSGFLGILIWVVIWPSLDVLFYEWRPQQHLIRDLERLSKLDLKIESHHS